MYCKKIKYQNYRNIENAEVALDKGVNVFIGNNAQGKTNAIEAVYYFARGKSFRGAKDKELIRLGAECMGMSKGQTFFCNKVTASNEYTKLTPAVSVLKRQRFTAT